MKIGVLGPGREATPVEETLAEEVGRALAQRLEKPILVCGGLEGVMRTAARGCFENGGTTVGLLPGITPQIVNPYLTAELPTGLGELRNWVVVNACDVFICVGGSWGTLSEISLAIRSGKRCFGLNSWTVANVDGTTRAEIESVETPRQAVQYAIAHLRCANDRSCPPKSSSSSSKS